MSTLLVAGPLALDDIGEHAGMIGGVGGYAAIAAAPLARTQLWARGGSAYTPQVRGILERRGIDLSGVSWDGPTPHGGPQGFQAHGELLPEIEPVSSEDLGGVLLIGLPPAEWRRALAVLARLPGGMPELVVASPRPADLEDDGFRTLCCAQAQVLILGAARARELSGAADSLAAARAFQKLGVRCVILTAGMLGGLMVYGDKAGTYPAMPVPALERTGISAAFPGAIAGWCAGSRKSDFHTLKRGCAIASVVGGLCAQGIGPKKLLSSQREDYLERFNHLRRLTKT